MSCPESHAAQCGELLDALLREGVKVGVRDGALVVEGEPQTMFGHVALETLSGRERAIEAALSIGATGRARLVEERHAVAARVRAERRCERVSKTLPLPAAAAASTTAGGRRRAPVDPPPPAPAFSREAE